MAELPDLEYLRKVFTRELSGKIINEAECLKPEELTMVVDGDFAERLAGLKITKIRRRGPFLILRTSGEERIVIDPGDQGHFKFPGLGTRRPRTLVFVLHMDGGPRVWFLDPNEKAHVWLTSKKELESVPELMAQGADPLGKNYTPDRFRRITRRAAEKGQTARQMLMDQEEISHIGPVFADEILFKAGIHPKAAVEDLTEDQLDKLYDSSLETLENACEIIEDRGQPIENMVRDFLRVHGRKDSPCRVCGEPIKTTKVENETVFYCGRCQAKKKAA